MDDKRVYIVDLAAAVESLAIELDSSKGYVTKEALNAMIEERTAVSANFAKLC